MVIVLVRRMKTAVAYVKKVTLDMRQIVIKIVMVIVLVKRMKTAVVYVQKVTLDTKQIVII